MALAEQGLDCMVMQAFSLGGLAAILAHLAAYIIPMKDELLPWCMHLDQTCVLNALRKCRQQKHNHVNIQRARQPVRVRDRGKDQDTG